MREIVRLEHSATPIDDIAVNAMMAVQRAAAQGLDTTNLEFLRAKGDALHPARYDLAKLRRIRAQNAGGRWWSALYQQNPVPADGDYFTKDQFKRQPAPQLLPAWHHRSSDVHALRASSAKGSSRPLPCSRSGGAALRR